MMTTSRYAGTASPVLPCRSRAWHAHAGAARIRNFLGGAYDESGSMVCRRGGSRMLGRPAGRARLGQCAVAAHLGHERHVGAGATVGRLADVRRELLEQPLLAADDVEPGDREVPGGAHGIPDRD